MAFAVGFVILYVTAILTPQGQQWDAVSLGAFPWLRSDGWLSLYEAREWLPFVLLGIAAVAGIESVIHRQWIAMVTVGCLLLPTALASSTFKGGLLPRPDLGDFAYNYQTFPSGHTAMSLAAVVAIIWFGPRWLNPALIVVLGMIVWFVAAASLLSYAHRASDIIGGALLVGAFACAISAIAGMPPTGRAAARKLWTCVGLLGIAASATFLGIEQAVLVGGVDVPLFIDAIALSAVVAVGGVVMVVLTNQHPAKTPQSG